MFATRAARRGPSRQLRGESTPTREGARKFVYEGDLCQTLEVFPTEHGFELDVSSELLEPIYSHLNHYTELDLYGSTAEKLYLSFSPCPEERIEITQSDYPIGRPARLAYLSAVGELRVVEGWSGEKGPFRLLASGAMKPGDPLGVVIYVGARAVCRLVWEDWSAQASSALSPTAGWGVTQNELGFTLVAPGRAYLWLTLADTSAGRGFDTVGHAPGVYRNRLRVEVLRE